jgi:tRNA(adenine34) deaminase
MDLWDDVDPVWRECFLLAWESFQMRSIPVGAVLVDARGMVVARGRNRWDEKSGPRGQIVGGNLAHAEINALAGLPSGDYSDHVLYSTLEPCFLCTAALRYSHVGTVRFAAPDPVWEGVDQLPRLNYHIARRWPRRDGPLGGPLQRLGVVLHLISALERGVGSVVDSHREAMPEMVRVAERLVGPAADGLRTMPGVEGLGLLGARLITPR